MTEEKVLSLDEIMEGDVEDGVRTLLEVLNVLEKNFAWKYIQKFFQEQAEVRKKKLFSQIPQKQADIYIEVYMRGEIQGFETAANAPDLIREHLQAAREAAAARRGDVKSEQDEASE